MKCKRSNSVFEEFLDLSLDISKFDDIEKSFEDFFAIDNLEGNNSYNCLKCKAQTPA
jgi:ubiquitin C-terminal hydrolase